MYQIISNQEKENFSTVTHIEIHIENSQYIFKSKTLSGNNKKFTSSYFKFNRIWYFRK